MKPIEISTLRKKVWYEIKLLKDYLDGVDSTWILQPACFTEEEEQYLRDNPEILIEARRFARKLVRWYSV